MGSVRLQYTRDKLNSTVNWYRQRLGNVKCFMFDKLSQQNIRIIQDFISPGESTLRPGEWDIGRNDRNSSDRPERYRCRKLWLWKLWKFAKEAKLLNSVKGHPNIVSFEAVSVSPFAIITEYLKFSFEPFADQKSVNSLADFLSHVHSQYDLNGFEQVVPVIAKRGYPKCLIETLLSDVKFTVLKGIGATKEK